MSYCWLLILFLIGSAQSFDLHYLFQRGLVEGSRAEGGGVPCIVCTILTSIIEQMSEIHGKTVEKVLEEFCTLLPSEAKATCTYYVDLYGAEIVKLIVAGYNADEVCHGIGMCTNPQCTLWSPSETAKEAGLPRPGLELLNLVNKKRAAQWDPWAWLKHLIDILASKHEPVVDLDGDLFSMEPVLRGSSWRGRDCNDLDSTHYAGRIETTKKNGVDQNCNGIFMKDGIDYEQQFCQNSGQMGSIVLGDSAGAHFHIPADWMNASAINRDTYKGLLFALANELDVPQASSWTGYLASDPNGPVDSLYLNLRKRNQCNHRDYQNIAVNGLRSGSALEVAKTIARNQTLDHPVFLVLELIGNDVCSSHHDFDHFTTPEDFEKNIVEILQYLDTILPAGSHVLTIGLAQGSALWDYMHAQTHPVGTTYANVYGYLNCMYSNPCWTWMNSNSTVRAAGDKRAAELSALYPKILSQHKFNNFDTDYFEFPLAEITKIWEARGGKNWQLIEPIDGFHPNQQADALIAEYVVKNINPKWLGPENPNNAKITQIFGDQNGY